MSAKGSIRNKKLKAVVVTLLEIIVVAAGIIGILMQIQSTLKTKHNSGSEIKNTSQGEGEEEKQEEGIEKYYLEVNVNQNAVTVYQYMKDSSDKRPIKVMKASIGRKVKPDKYKLKETYTWLNTNKSSWNKYNVRYSAEGWFQSAEYDDKYSWTIKPKSYNAIGTSKSKDANIRLTAQDAAWIFTNCAEGTVVRVISGDQNDKLPLALSPDITIQKECGWDPTDPEEGNPYKTVQMGAVSAYSGTVYIEKGQEPDYYANVIAFNSKGKNITKKLSFKKIDVSQVGEYTVPYTYKKKDGTKMKASVKYKVVDTTVPVISFSQNKFIYEVLSKAEKDLNTDSVKKAIEKLVRSHASASEGTLAVTALPKEQLVIGDNPVRVTAVDPEGNVGAAEATVEIKVKAKKLNKKYEPPKNQKEKNTKNKEKK